MKTPKLQSAQEIQKLFKETPNTRETREPEPEIKKKLKSLFTWAKQIRRKDTIKYKEFLHTKNSIVGISTDEEKRIVYFSIRTPKETTDTDSTATEPKEETKGTK